MNRKIGLAATAAYIATVVLANWAVERFGVVGVGFGLMAPAGVYAVGVAFTLRDVIHERLGRLAAALAVVVGSVVSLAVASRSLALASFAAFLASESADLVVYDRLRRRNLVAALVASNLVGIVVDSLLFLYIAFGSLEFFWGQFVGKAWMTLLAVAVLLPARRALLPRHP